MEKTNSDVKTQIAIAVISLLSSVITGVIVGQYTSKAAINSAHIQSSSLLEANTHMINNSREMLEKEYDLKRELETKKEKREKLDKQTTAINYFISILNAHITNLEIGMHQLQVLIISSPEDLLNKYTIDIFDITNDALEALSKQADYRIPSLFNDKLTAKYIEQLQSDVQIKLFDTLTQITLFHSRRNDPLSQKLVDDSYVKFLDCKENSEKKVELAKVYVRNIDSRAKMDVVSMGSEIYNCLLSIRALEEEKGSDLTTINKKLEEYSSVNDKNMKRFKKPNLEILNLK